VIGRVVLAAVAILVLAWLGILERDHRLFLRGAGASTLARADSDLRAASLLNPDSKSDLYRALRMKAAGRWHEAVTTVERVLRREPDNLFAWTTLASIAQGRDPAAVRRARAAARRLDPLGAREPRQPT
jgi:predicted Zn-dependent protease